MAFWKTEHFIALQKAWYQRLKDSGFDDQEEFAADDLVLKQRSYHAYRGTTELTRVSKESYFNMLGQFSQSTIFKNDVDRLIMTLYAEGRNIKAICQELEIRGQSRDRSTIRFRIRLYEMKWGIRSYKPKSLHYLKVS